jgi:transcription elongation factor GreA
MEKIVFLTPEGHARFTSELRELVTVRRLEVEERLHNAKEFSDAVDNAEYDEVKQEQAFVEGRIHELERILANAKLIEEPQGKDYVRLGSRVTVLDSEGDEETYHLVGSQEADPRHGQVSNESPIGRAILGKKCGDVVDVVAPGGSFRLTIRNIA